MEQNYIPFTEEMKKEYTILTPNMLPVHFKLILQVMRNYGYRIELLESNSREIPEIGLKYVHNDTCYPAILVIGQFLEAIQSGKYDPHKVALILFQTGGGCRASNYISLLRKALKKAGYDYIPVISFSLAGIEDHPGFRLTLPILYRMFCCVVYGDLILSLTNQCKPYELHRGDTEALSARWTKELADDIVSHRLSFQRVKEKSREIIASYASLPMKRVKKPKVGIVGEIFVKYSPLGNNNLEQFLVDEGAEAVIPGLLDFCIYCVYADITDFKMYKMKKLRYPLMKFLYGFLLKKQREMIRMLTEEGSFRAPTPFDHTLSLRNEYIGEGCKMGEGWLLPAEMLELADSGVKNIICTQPFGCLPNHICGKGMMKPIKDKNPDINIVAIDYDAGATQVNQENRIKLMLSNAE